MMRFSTNAADRLVLDRWAHGQRSRRLRAYVASISDHLVLELKSNRGTMVHYIGRHELARFHGEWRRAVALELRAMRRMMARFDRSVSCVC